MSPDEIRSIVAARKPESLTLEFKQTLPGETDNDKREFLADVSAFANAYGGAIIFGILDEDRCAAEVTGVAGDNLDNAILRLTHLLRDAVEPRIQNLAFEVFETDGRNVIELRIPQSPLRPHWVALKGHNKFYIRHSAGKHPMSIDEIRASLLAASGAAERAEQWRDARANAVLKLAAGGNSRRAIHAILHLVPLAAANAKLDVGNFTTRVLPTVLYNSTNGRPNHHGSLTTAQDDHPESSYEYLQVYRDYRIEAVFEGGVQADGNKCILQSETEANIIRWLESAKPWFASVSYPFPAALFLSYACGGQMRLMENHKVQTTASSVLLFDSSSIEGPEFKPDAVMRPIYDHVWQTFSVSQCPNYSDNGEWVTKIR